MTDDELARVEALGARIRMAGGWVSDAGYTDAASLLKFFAISKRTFLNWRNKDFPPGYELGRTMWDLLDVLQWMEKRRASSTADESRRRARAESGKFGHIVTCSRTAVSETMASPDWSDQ